jgi:hypothetical protein
MITIRLFDALANALISVEVGRFKLSLLMWCRPCVEWGRWGYDCIWRSWAVYPLFEAQIIQRDVFEPRDGGDSDV